MTTESYNVHRDTAVALFSFRTVNLGSKPASCEEAQVPCRQTRAWRETKAPRNQMLTRQGCEENMVSEGLLHPPSHRSGWCNTEQRHPSKVSQAHIAHV